MDRFLALDVETANADMASICQIGIVEFQDNKLINQWGSYINPKDYFDPFNIEIHGITPEMVENSPMFPEIHQTICRLIEGNIVVTHMPFDQTALSRAAQKYDLKEISCTWLDSARVVRRQWEQFRKSGYGLVNISNHLGINYKAHDAQDDARAAGEVVIRAMQESNQKLEEWLIRAYRNIPISKDYISQTGNPEGQLFGETIVFTGALSLVRSKAAQMAAQAGCDVSDGVTEKTTILVVGIQDQDKLAGYDKSSKHRKAEKLISEGQPIKIITEIDFLDLIS